MRRRGAFRPAPGLGGRAARLAVLLGVAAASLWLPSVGGGQSSDRLLVERPLIGWRESLPVTTFDGEPYLQLRDVARIAECSFTWRSDVAKGVLRSRRHALKFTAENPFVVVDETNTLQLTHPVRLRAGELYLPLSAIVGALQGLLSQEAQIEDDRLVLVLEEPNAGLPEIQVADGQTHFLLPVLPRTSAAILSPRAERFEVRVPNLRLPPIAGDSLPPAGLVQRLHFDRQPAGLRLQLELAPSATSYRLRQPAGDSLLEISFARGPKPAEFVELTPPVGLFTPRPFRVLVLDPGHGGSDSGYVAPGVREKDLTLELARRVRLELSRTLPGVRVLLTREGDAGVTLSERVQVANRAHADLYLSLHFDGLRGSQLAGAAAFVAPPLEADRSRLLGHTSDVTGQPTRRLRLVSWQRAAGRHHAEARAVAEQLLEAVADAGFGPSRLRIARSYPTQGADCPAVLLECGTLSSPQDRGRLTTPEGVSELARAIARGLRVYAAGGG